MVIPYIIKELKYKNDADLMIGIFNTIKHENDLYKVKFIIPNGEGNAYVYFEEDLSLIMTEFLLNGECIDGIFMPLNEFEILRDLKIIVLDNVKYHISDFHYKIINDTSQFRRRILTVNLLES